MFPSTYSSFQHQAMRKLLDKFSDSLLVLKLAAQNQLEQHNLDEDVVTQKRMALSEVLANLVATVRLMSSKAESQENTLENLDLSYLGLAAHFIDINSRDVDDRLYVVEKIIENLKEGKSLQSRDFNQLDGLQAYLESEVIDKFKDFFRY